MASNVLILGNLGHGFNQHNGQTIKTRNVYLLLRSRIESGGRINHFDTQLLWQNPFSLFVMIRKILSCDKLVYLPAESNLKYGFPIVYFLCRMKHIDILYIVVGGWLTEFLQANSLHLALVSKIRGVFVESNQLRDKLVHQFQLKNVVIFPNFRMHSFVPSFRMNNDTFKIVFMARITPSKGIDAVFHLAEHIEGKYKREHKITIDFYGAIDNTKSEEHFRKQVDRFPFVAYRGIVESEQVHTVLDQYDLVVLPTKYPGEGFPGTILDAYISGLPVVVSNWRYLPEFVDDGITGYVYDVDCEEEFYRDVDKLYLDRKLLLQMKHNAHAKSRLYSSEAAWRIIEEYLK